MRSGWIRLEHGKHRTKRGHSTGYPVFTCAQDVYRSKDCTCHLAAAWKGRDTGMCFSIQIPICSDLSTHVPRRQVPVARRRHRPRIRTR